MEEVMKKIFSGVLVFTGVVFLLFVVNIVLYSAVPGYRAALSKAVGKDAANGSGAGVNVSAAGNVNVNIDENQADGSNDAMSSGKYGISVTGIENSIATKTFEKTDHEKNLIDKRDTETDDTDRQPVIVDKEYHEDCGTGKGYWVITYSDGSTSIE